MLNRRSFIQYVGGGAAALASSSIFPPARVLGANDRVRFGLIGAGGRGMEIFKTALHVPNTQAVAVADVYTRRLDEAKQLVPGIQVYSDFRRLLDDKSLDAVLIATPQHQHALSFVPSIQAGKDVYQEKTMAFNPDHARRMRRALEGSNRVVQVGVQSVSGKAFQRARALAIPERMGNITAIHTHHYRNKPYGGWRRSIPADCNPAHVDWKGFEGEAAPHDFDPQRFINWRFFWDYSGGNVFENMVHQVAFWYKVLGLKIPRRATMSGYNYLSPDMEVPDTMDVSMDQPENLLFTWSSAFGNNYYGEDGNDLALGNKGTVIRVVDDVAFLPQGNHETHKHGNPKAVGGEPDIVGSSDDADTDLHMRNFFDCVRNRHEPNCPFALGYTSAIACQMAIASLRQGRTVQWDPVKEDIV
ncbi:MAG TPA: Gfo/Idh/MocA family oxidoreductase [Candidatus Limnocylindrales bacterium]|nr:Gfo/Idh/MocA family oxidoreductase [Candidatus Limnocylindrales bacterium]